MPLTFMTKTQFWVAISRKPTDINFSQEPARVNRFLEYEALRAKKKKKKTDLQITISLVSLWSVQ